MGRFRFVLGLIASCLLTASAIAGGDDQGQPDINQVYVSGTLSDVWVTAPGPQQRVVLFIDSQDHEGNVSSIPIVCHGPNAIGFNCTDYVGRDYLGYTVLAGGYVAFDPLVGGLSIRAIKAPFVRKPNPGNGRKAK